MQIVEHDFEKDGSLDMYFTYTDISYLNEAYETVSEPMPTATDQTNASSQPEQPQQQNKNNKNNKNNKENSAHQKEFHAWKKLWNNCHPPSKWKI